MSVEYKVFPEDRSGATETFGIAYLIPGEQHILCGGMYKWQAEWLCSHLKMCSTVNPEFYLRAPRAELSKENDHGK